MSGIYSTSKAFSVLVYCICINCKWVLPITAVFSFEIKLEARFRFYLCIRCPKSLHFCWPYSFSMTVVLHFIISSTDHSLLASFLELSQGLDMLLLSCTVGSIANIVFLWTICARWTDVKHFFLISLYLSYFLLYSYAFAQFIVVHTVKCLGKSLYWEFSSSWKAVSPLYRIVLYQKWTCRLVPFPYFVCAR